MARLHAAVIPNRTRRTTKAAKRQTFGRPCRASSSDVAHRIVTLLSKLNKPMSEHSLLAEKAER